MLEQILRHLNNWFLVERYEGGFAVEDGSITLPFLKSGQYFRIMGSLFNDGLYQYPVDGLTDESFDGTIWALAVPKAVVDMAEDIASWQKKYGDTAASPYTNESFGGYSYSKGSASKSDGVVSWQSAFRDRLNDWRRLRGV